MRPLSAALIAVPCALAILGASASSSFSPRPATLTVPVQTALKNTLNRYLRERGKVEHISAASLSVSLRNRATIDVAAGTTSYGGHDPVTPANLYQIGSNTKAFTAVVMLKLGDGSKVTLHQTVGDWLPQYRPWKNVTIAQLFNMTSGIQTYDDTRAWEDAFVADPLHTFTPAELIAYINPNDPLKGGWHYSNTNYILAQLIEEKASGQSYADLVRGLIASAHLPSTYYFTSQYPASIRNRTVAGYYDNVAAGGGLARIVGRNLRDDSLSWTQSAGGIVSTPHDIAQWARQLYQGSIVTAAQRAELETLVSNRSGKPIARASQSDPHAFGLGLAQIYLPAIGHVWFYEGMTLGYRLAHAYFPSEDVVIVIGLNSQPNSKEDRIGELATDVYRILGDYGLLSRK